MSDFHWIVMIDEIKFLNDNYDLSQLKLKYPNVDIHLAINPIGDYCTFPFNPIFPNEEENTIIEKLKNCHRNSLEIALLLLHLNACIMQRSISNEDNLPIHKTCLTAKSKPLWILARDQLSNETILEVIKTKLGSSTEDVALLHDYQEKNESVESWCQRNNWNYIEYYEMAGSEASILVLFEIEFRYSEYLINECYSRAKRRLFIVQR